MLLKDHIKYLNCVDLSSLSKRRHYIALLRMNGLSLKEIGRRMNLSGVYVGYLIDSILLNHAIRNFKWEPYNDSEEFIDYDDFDDIEGLT